ncbi:MAG: hypothetical protein K1X28_05000 [Parachlamydiales bacterium]|nr:hypothetical protein [Parachlamydiales bacterium]
MAIGFIQFTNYPHQYPFGTPEFCSISAIKPGMLEYTFSTLKAAQLFADHFKEWASELPLATMSFITERPFEKATEFFPANPAIESHIVRFTFSRESDPRIPYIFSQRVGELGLESLS